MKPVCRWYFLLKPRQWWIQQTLSFIVKTQGFLANSKFLRNENLSSIPFYIKFCRCYIKRSHRYNGHRRQMFPGPIQYFIFVVFNVVSTADQKMFIDHSVIYSICIYMTVLDTSSPNFFVAFRFSVILCSIPLFACRSMLHNVIFYITSTCCL